MVRPSDKGAKTIQWGKDRFSTSGAGKTRSPHPKDCCEILNLNHPEKLTPNRTKI